MWERWGRGGRGRIGREGKGCTRAAGWSPPSPPPPQTNVAVITIEEASREDSGQGVLPPDSRSKAGRAPDPSARPAGPPTPGRRINHPLTSPERPAPRPRRDLGGTPGGPRRIVGGNPSLPIGRIYHACRPFK